METTKEVTSSCPIKFTPPAFEEFKKIAEEKDISNEYGLRVGVKGGGCSGLSYILGFDRIKDNDQVFKYDGLTVIMEKAHGMYLVGMEIDYYEGLDNRGFVFNNPNADETCGCGSSFSA